METVDELDYDDIETKLLRTLGFCVCGMPDDALRLINDLLSYIAEYQSGKFAGSFSGPEWDAHREAGKKTLKQIIDSNYDGVCYTLFYLLADKEITEHGGSVPGWIEDHQFHDKLKLYIEHINSQKE